MTSSFTSELLEFKWQFSPDDNTYSRVFHILEESLSYFVIEFKDIKKGILLRPLCNWQREIIHLRNM